MTNNPTPYPQRRQRLLDLIQAALAQAWHGGSERGRRRPAQEIPGPPSVINVSGTIGGDLNFAGRDLDAGPKSDATTSERGLAGITRAFVIGVVASIVAGLALYHWTTNGDQSSSSANESPSDPPAPAGEAADAAFDDAVEGGNPGGLEARQGTVHGCNTYGGNCDGNPIYDEVPPEGYDWAAWPILARVDNGTVLTARCWALGGMTYNYRVDPPDHGPDPYASETYFNVQAPDGRWGWIPDTYFVRDQGNRMGLPRCSTTT